MESTGNYWITLYDVLTAAGVDAYHPRRARRDAAKPSKNKPPRSASPFQPPHNE